jgi:hypothetical protein
MREFLDFLEQATGADVDYHFVPEGFFPLDCWCLWRSQSGRNSDRDGTGLSNEARR